MSKPKRQLAAIMFTDIVGYTRLMAESEENALALLNKNRQLHKELIEKHHGTWLKELGDGTLSYFNSVTDAALCALELQEKSLGDEELRLRIGLHQVILQKENKLLPAIMFIKTLKTSGSSSHCFLRKYP